MTWQAGATLDALVTFVATIPGIQSVRKGEPLTLPYAVSAFISVGAHPVADFATSGRLDRSGEFWITFGYRIGDASATAEDTLADVLDEFMRRFFDERKDATPLGGTVEDMELDMSPASAAEYRPMGGQEFRLYPVIVRVRQTHTVT